MYICIFYWIVHEPNHYRFLSFVSLSPLIKEYLFIPVIVFCRRPYGLITRLHPGCTIALISLSISIIVCKITEMSSDIKGFVTCSWRRKYFTYMHFSWPKAQKGECRSTYDKMKPSFFSCFWSSKLTQLLFKEKWEPFLHILTLSVTCVFLPH